MSDLAVTGRIRTLNAVKSLLGFGHRIGYLRFDVGRAVKPPRAKNTLAERIPTERETLAMIHRTEIGRDHAILATLPEDSSARYLPV